MELKMGKKISLKFYPFKVPNILIQLFKKQIKKECSRFDKNGGKIVIIRRNIYKNFKQNIVYKQ